MSTEQLCGMNHKYCHNSCEYKPRKCVCGKYLEPHAVKELGLSQNAILRCDNCYQKIGVTETIFHCPIGKTKSKDVHPNGFDICEKCFRNRSEPFSNKKIIYLQELDLGYDTEEILCALQETNGNMPEVIERFSEEKQAQTQRFIELNQLFDAGLMLQLKDTKHQYFTEQKLFLKPSKHSHCDDDIIDCIHFGLLLSNYGNPRLCSTDIALLLDNFLHLLNKHDSDVEFELIAHALGSCEMSKCRIVKRHYRMRNHTSVELKEQERYHPIMDKIHCYFVHSLGMGHRISVSDRKLIQQFEDTKPQKSPYLNNSCSKNEYHRILSKRHKQYTDMSDRDKSKFNQLQMKSNFGKNKKYFSFGFLFQYGGQGILADEKDEKTENTLFIETAKYSSMKEEVLMNQVSVLNLSQFNSEYHKACMYYHTLYRKSKYPKMSVQELLSLVIYCNFDNLQHEFSKTYRRIAENESLESVKKRHQNFFTLGKNLTFAINTFGDVSKQYLYHGISEKLVFPSYLMKVFIHSPLSATTEFPVALNFANTNGIVVQFEPSRLGKDQKHACLSLSLAWLSDFTNEKEHLFIQSKGSFFIDNIIDPQLTIEYLPILKALDFLETPSSYRSIDDTYFALIQRIIHYQLSKCLTKYTPFPSLDPYSRHIIDVYFSNKKYFEISYKQKLLKDFIHPKYKFFQMPLIHVLCPNVETIHIRNVNLCTLLLEYIYGYLKLEKIRISNLKLIWIKPAINSDESIDDLISQYGSKFGGIGFTVAKVKDIGYQDKCSDPYYVAIQSRDLINQPKFTLLCYYDAYKNVSHRIPNFTRL